MGRKAEYLRRRGKGPERNTAERNRSRLPAGRPFLLSTPTQNRAFSVKPAALSAAALPDLGPSTAPEVTPEVVSPMTPRHGGAAKTAIHPHVAMSPHHPHQTPILVRHDTTIPAANPLRHRLLPAMPAPSRPVITDPTPA